MKLYRSCIDKRQQQTDQSSKKKQLQSEIVSLQNKLTRAELRHKETEQKFRLEKVSSDIPIENLENIKY